MAERLLGLLLDLRQAGVLASYGWAKGLNECEGALRHLLAATILREIPLEPLEPFHHRAARAARGAAFHHAAWWHEAWTAAFRTDDPEVLARVVAGGALQPLQESTRFEIAVMMRLVQSLWDLVQQRNPSSWHLVHTLVLPGRRELARLERDDGASISVYYNQSVLQAGPSDRGSAHYLGSHGRLRPDGTVVMRSSDGLESAVVLEIKLSADVGYLVSGYHEANLYAAEYAPQLRGWPKAILVIPGATVGAPRLVDDVIGSGWKAWPPREVLDAMVEHVDRHPLPTLAVPA